MKTSFSSNSQLCHVYAQQKQENGKTKNLFFINTTDMYSYGLHFLAAKVYPLKSGKIVLVNSKTYSPSTGGHLSDIRGAFRSLDGIRLFEVPRPGIMAHEENINYYDQRVINAIDSIFTTLKVKSKDSVQYSLNHLRGEVKTANDFFNLIGHKNIIIPAVLMTVLEEHLNFRLLRTIELDSGLEDRQKKAAIKLEQKNKVLFEALPSLKNGWRVSGSNETLNKILSIVGNSGLDIFRVTGERVVTSRGASVSLKTALAVVKKLIDNSLKAGENVDNFQVSKVGSDTLKIGCHCFDIKETLETFAPYLSLN